MRRSTYLWTVLALALVALLAVACEQPVNPAPKNTTMPTDMAFPTDYARGTAAAIPTLPNAPSPKATAVPAQPTEKATLPPPTKAPAVVTTPAPTNPPAATAVPSPTKAPTAGPAGEVLYTVQPGDNLFRIALAYNLSWQTVAAYNGITNPNAIFVGQVLKIPTGGGSATPVPGSNTYVVKAGDTLFMISLAYNLSWQTVAQYNGITWPYWVYPGQVLKIP